MVNSLLILIYLLLGQDPLPMHVAIAGLEPRTGCWEYLQKEVLLQPIRIVPLGIGSNNGECLEAVIFLKKVSIVENYIEYRNHLVKKNRHHAAQKRPITTRADF